MSLEPWNGRPVRPSHKHARWETPAEQRKRERRERNREWMPWWVWVLMGFALAAMAYSAMPMPV